MRMSLRSLIYGVLLLLLLLGASLPARAQSDADKATARELAIEGQKALDAGNHEAALDRFQRADALFHAPTLVLGAARAYRGLGRYVQAREAYNRVIREPLPPNAPPAFQQAVDDAKRELPDVEGKIAWVVIRVEGPKQPKVQIDDTDVPVASLGVRRAVNPGEHVVRASADGFAPAERKVKIDPAGSSEVTLKLEPSAAAAAPVGLPAGAGSQAGAPEPRSAPATPAGPDDADPGATQRVIGIVGLAVGGAALAMGAITGGLAIGKHGDLEESCEGGRCPRSEQDTLDSFHTLGTVSTVGFIAGGVIATAGLVVLLTAPSSGGETALRLGPTSAGITRRF